MTIASAKSKRAIARIPCLWCLGRSRKGEMSMAPQVRQVACDKVARSMLRFDARRDIWSGRNAHRKTW
jgi:hypothetical protein